MFTYLNNNKHFFNLNKCLFDKIHNLIYFTIKFVKFCDILK